MSEPTRLGVEGGGLERKSPWISLSRNHWDVLPNQQFRWPRCGHTSGFKPNKLSSREGFASCAV